jgi:hypothetical protein
MDRTPDHLVGMAGINTQADRHIDGLVESGRRLRQHGLDRGLERQRTIRDLGPRRTHAFGKLRHRRLLARIFHVIADGWRGMREGGGRMQARSMAVAMVRGRRRASGPRRQARRREMQGDIPQINIHLNETPPCHSIFQVQAHGHHENTG